MKYTAQAIFILLTTYALSHPKALQKDHTNTLHTLITSNYFNNRNNTQQAELGFKALLKQEDAPSVAYKGHIKLLFSQKKYQEIIALLPTMKEPQRNDPDIEFLIALAFEKTGKQQQADEILIKLSQNFPTHQEIIYHAVSSYRRQREIPNAISIIDDYLNKTPRRPNNFIFYFLKAQLCVEMHQKEDAQFCVTKSLEMYPHFDQGWLLQGILAEQTGKIPEAITGYTKFLELSPQNPQAKKIQQHLIQLSLKQNILSAKENKNDEPLQEAITSLEQKQYDKGLKKINESLKNNPNNKDAALIKYELLKAQGKKHAAFKFVKKLLYQMPDSQDVYLLVQDLVNQGISSRVMHKMLITLHQNIPHNNLPLTCLMQLRPELKNNVALYETDNHPLETLAFLMDTP